MKGNLNSNNVTDTMLAQLPFIGDAVQVIGYPKNAIEVYKMYAIDGSNLVKLKKLLEGGLMPNLPKKSKVYLLPNCMYTQVQMRTILKMHGYTLTTDISKANLFVGNSDSVRYADNTNPAPALCTEGITLKSYTIASAIDELTIESKLPGHTSSGMLNYSIGTTLYFTNRYYNVKDSWTYLYSTDADYNLVSGECVEILHRHLSAGVPIVNEINLFNSVERVVIDDDIYNTLNMMLDASSEDRRLAAEMIFNADYDKSFYNIVKLVRLKGYYITNYMNTHNYGIFKRVFPEHLRYDNFDKILTFVFKSGYLTEDAYYDIVNIEMDKHEDEILKNLEKLKEFFAVDLFIKKSYQEYINENTPKNEESKSIPAGSGSSNTPF